MSGHFDDDVEQRQVALQPQWVCPHCKGQRPHFSDAQGCERHGDPEHDPRIAIGPTDI